MSLGCLTHQQNGLPASMRPLFRHFLALGEDLRKVPGTSYHTEAALTSRDSDASWKVIHVLRLHPAWQGRSFNCSFAAAACIGLFSMLNKKQGDDFNLSALSRLFTFPLSAAGKNDIMILYARINKARGCIDKLSVHMHPCREADTLSFACDERIIAPSRLRPYVRGLEFIGVDFDPSGQCSLKTYQGKQWRRSELRNPLCSRIFSASTVVRGLRATRFAKRCIYPANDYFFLGSVPLTDLCRQAQGSEPRIFLRKQLQRFPQADVAWISLKHNKTEVYLV